MAANSRIYLVTGADSAPAPERLVRASSPAQAIRHVVRQNFRADVATQEDLIRLAKTTDVEDAAQEAGE